MGKAGLPGGAHLRELGVLAGCLPSAPEFSQLFVALVRLRDVVSEELQMLADLLVGDPVEPLEMVEYPRLVVLDLVGGIARPRCPSRCG
jgi:hypothetical protein